MKEKSELKEIKKWILLVLIAVISYWSLNNLSVIGGVIAKIFKVFLPFILGGVFAFILNIPMTKIEKLLKKNCKWIKSPKMLRLISIILSLLIFLLIIFFVAFLLIPELIENIELLMNNIPTLIAKCEEFIYDLFSKYPDLQVQIKDWFTNTGNLSNVLSNILNYIINGAVGFITNIVSGFITIFTALIFSIYMLSQKEYLLKGIRKVLFAILPRNKAIKVEDVGVLANKTFGKFISGQCVEAVILGGLIFISCIICGFPYALIIAVLTTITALIPIFGAMIALAVGAVLIAITSPIQALFFIIVFLVVQQIEGNFIYPKVVGASVGLSPLWTLLAVSVGGNLFGVLGMVIGLPLASIGYALIKSSVNEKLKKKDISIS